MYHERSLEWSRRNSQAPWHANRVTFLSSFLLAVYVYYIISFFNYDL